MKSYRWQFVLGSSLLFASAVLYAAQLAIFRNPRDIAFYFFQDLAFLPVEVFLVTLIIHRLLSGREKRERMEKMNMVIGTFFSEAGTGLIGLFADFVEDFEDLGRPLRVRGDWTSKRFDESAAALGSHTFVIDSRKSDLPKLKAFLSEKHEFLLRLLANPNLIEHDTFTDLLRAVFHLSEELDYRGDFSALPQADLDHLSGDMRRAFTFLSLEWLAYLRHLKNNYPYLFSLAVRMNPFDPEASPVVR